MIEDGQYLSYPPKACKWPIKYQNFLMKYHFNQLILSFSGYRNLSQTSLKSTMALDWLMLLRATFHGIKKDLQKPGQVQEPQRI